MVQARKICDAGVMKADRVEVSRDTQKKRWLIRIQVGEEVIRRYCNESEAVDAAKLRVLAAQTVTDEGYTIDASEIVLT
jgi:hypothetical protein